ncbi:hypothetical protein WA1_13225 [Scytonema hofmannii PCC 7110]|uniref:Uncharacterized protein n=1 Tax=Scytonema hofmannii PCC 7110 TaxID=128403 RepID=A0A139XEC8_9CYAN|nr:hypothetical protein [Scytonema hofmannii]KYC43057.1 hypothetical protein WA1_13225 [Scytonema hofmannii PCC 7110]
MLDLNSLAELSRVNCVSLCAFLVPANLVATIVTMVLIALGRSPHQIWRSAAVASFLALIMVLHVYTWFAVGIVMAPTYILLLLALSCLLTNLGAILFQRHFITVTSDQ